MTNNHAALAEDLATASAYLNKAKALLSSVAHVPCNSLRNDDLALANAHADMAGSILKIQLRRCLQASKAEADLQARRLAEKAWLEQYNEDRAREERVRLLRKEQERARRAHQLQLTRERAKAAITQLADCQRFALAYAAQVASAASTKALPRLLGRAKALGLDASDIHAALDYIRHKAPLLIHVNEISLEQLSRESHYKNRREFGGFDNQRASVENQLYLGCYHDVSPPYLIKYGCLNCMNCASGVAPAVPYGSCFLELSPEVRHRCTFHFGDTYSTLRTVGTPECFAHVLEMFPENEIMSVAAVASGRAAHCHPREYTECHIHGAIVIDRDICAVHAPRNCRMHAANFQARGIECKFF